MKVAVGQAGKIDNLQQVCGVSISVALRYGGREIIMVYSDSESILLLQET